MSRLPYRPHHRCLLCLEPNHWYIKASWKHLSHAPNVHTVHLRNSKVRVRLIVRVPQRRRLGLVRIVPEAAQRRRDPALLLPPGRQPGDWAVSKMRKHECVICGLLNLARKHKSIISWHTYRIGACALLDKPQFAQTPKQYMDATAVPKWAIL